MSDGIKSAVFHGIEGKKLIFNIGAYLWVGPDETLHEAILSYKTSSEGKTMLASNLQTCIADAENNTDGIYEIYKVNLLTPRHLDPVDNEPYAVLDCIIKTKLRDVVLAAAKRLLPEQGELVPEFINLTTFLNMVAQDCFINDRSGKDVEKVRAGLKILNKTGVLE